MLKLSQLTDTTIKAWLYRRAVDSNWRKINGGPEVDGLFITNMRDKKDRERFMGEWRPEEGFYDGPIVYNNCVAGKTRAIDFLAEDLLFRKNNKENRNKANEARKKARELFIAAARQAQEEGVSGILLAASTKKFFGENGEKLKKLFPDMYFTIGDNVTIDNLREETDYAFNEAGLGPGRCRVAVLGASGIIGRPMISFLAEKNYNVIAVDKNIAPLQKYGVEACEDLNGMGRVDAVIACTHNADFCLKAEHILQPNFIRKKNKKLLVIDVSAPPNFKYKDYQECKNLVVRMDGGNAYSPKLRYVLGALSYRTFRLSDGVVFGCFGELLAWLEQLAKGNFEAKNYNGFLVNEENIGIAGRMKRESGFGMPSPRCFSKPFRSFNLDISEALPRQAEVIRYSSAL